MGADTVISVRMTADQNKIISNMDQKKVNRILKEVIKQAQDTGIPVPADICEQVDINPRPKKRYGCCRLKNGVYHIEISEFILACDLEKISEVMAHEVLHTCKGCYNHGNMWKRYAAMMNSAYGYDIKRTSSNEEMGIQDANVKGKTYSGVMENPETAEKPDIAAGGGTAAGRSNGAGRETGTSAGRVKYIIKCRKCGREYPRQRCSAAVKNSKAYRCRCGGRLTVFEIRRTADLYMKTT